MSSKVTNCLTSLVLVTSLLLLLPSLLLSFLAIHLLSNSLINTINSIILGSGLTVSVIALIGCFGAIYKSRCLLVLYTLSLILLTGSQLNLLPLIYYQVVDITPLVTSASRETVKYEYSGQGRVFWDQLQQGLSCCGAAGPDDWAESQFNGYHQDVREIGIGGAAANGRQGYRVPASCCRNTTSQGCPVKVENRDEFVHQTIIHMEGCSDKIMVFIKNNYFYLVFFNLGIFFIELLGVMFTIFLFCSLKKKKSNSEEVYQEQIN